MRQTLNTCSAIALSLCSFAAIAQNYPVKPIRIIVTFPPAAPVTSLRAPSGKN